MVFQNSQFILFFSKLRVKKVARSIGKLAWCYLISLSSIVCGWMVIADEANADAREVLIIVGAGGTSEYLESFRASADRWERAFDGRVKITTLGMNAESNDTSDPQESDRQRILDWVAREPSSEDAERWVIFIGHGTYQLNVAKLNLEGPDLSADDLSKAMATRQSPWRIFICSSCSSPFINALSGKNRIIVTATKSGSEQNYSRFATFFSQSIGDSTSDLDHDGRVSILEGFLVASRNLSNWYIEDGRLASEQALLDDNGDKRGTPASFFRGIRAAQAPADGLQLDGKLANRVFVSKIESTIELTQEQSKHAADIEEKIDAIRARKAEMDEATYYAQLEPLMMELARLMVASNSDDGRANRP